MSLTEQLINGQSGYEVKKWHYSAILKLALFTATNSLPRKTRYISLRFQGSYLKPNKVSKSKWIMKVD